MLRQAEQAERRVRQPIVVVAIVLGVVVVFFVSEREERLPTARERVEALVADHPTLPVALPV